MGVVYTSRIGCKEESSLDITVKSATGNGKILAPTWELVGGYKRWPKYQPLTDEEYTEKYLALLRSRYKSNKQIFIEIASQPVVVLLCYCRLGVFCHRHIAVEVLEKIANANDIMFYYGGELPIEPKESD